MGTAGHSDTGGQPDGRCGGDPVNADPVVDDDAGADKSNACKNL